MDPIELLGRAAFEAGKPRIPALDPLVRQEIEGMPVGTGAVDIFERWIEGWDAAHRRYATVMENLRYESYTEGGQP